jgi:diguanylate cyclase (GGDEF)-like protein
MGAWKKDADAGQTARETVRRTRSTVRALPRSYLYPPLGALLALGAPLGFGITCAIVAGRTPAWTWIIADLARHPVTYSYLAVVTGAVFAFAAYLLGRLHDHRLRSSHTDLLTGLSDRRHFHERLAAELQRSRRYDHPASLLLIEIDRLGTIHHTLGHQAGDDALISVSRTVATHARATDAVARIDGDLLAVLLPETSAVAAFALSQRILVDMARQADMAASPPSVSIGIAELDLDHDAGHTLAAAHAALIQAQTCGGGQVAFAKRARAVAPTTKSRRHSTMSEAAMLFAGHAHIQAAK